MAAGLFDPCRAGAIALANRIVMAPLTRCRASAGGVPDGLMAEYYAQRAQAGLIVAEATAVSADARGWTHAPAIATQEQAHGWKRVTDAVRAAGGRIVLQLWHLGDAVHPDFAGAPVAGSPLARGPASYDATALHRIIDDFSAAAGRALDAGFDGVEIHAAYGYLIDGFLRRDLNARDDAYGGDAQNRLRLLEQVCDAVMATAGADRTGVRLSPRAENADACEAAAKILSNRAAYLHVAEKRGAGDEQGLFSPRLREAFGGFFIANGGLDPAGGKSLVTNGGADAVSYGRAFIANPDLVQRVAQGAPLNRTDAATYVSGGKKGYTDYPKLR